MVREPSDAQVAVAREPRYHRAVTLLWLALAGGSAYGLATAIAPGSVLVLVVLFVVMALVWAAVLASLEVG